MKKSIYQSMLMIAISVLTTSTAAALPTYTFTDLGTLGGIASYANAINSSGQIVGYSWTADGQVHASLWSGTVAKDLGALGGDFSIANDINDIGQVVGYASGDTYRQRAVMWNGTTATDIGTNFFFNATAINNAGQVVVDGSIVIPGNGYSSQDSSAYRAFLLNGSTATDLSTLGGRNSHATAINNVGQVVGYADVTVGDTRLSGRRAALWNSTTITNLGGWDTINTSTAYAINDFGQVAGSTFFAGSGARATVWKENIAIELVTPGANQSSAFGINTIGQVVGSASIISSNELRAILWNETTGIDLNSFLDTSTATEWLLTEAKDINNNGWIVGNATNKTTGFTHAYVLTPVPEPGSYSILLMGLGLIGFVTRRHKTKQ